MSENFSKLPVSILSEKVQYTTPWHCAPALELDGSWKFAHSEVFFQDQDYELVLRDGQPSYYRRKSEYYPETQSNLDMTPLQPCGLMISPKEGVQLSMDTIDMQKARKLAELNSPLVFRNFTNTNDRSLFILKAREMGPVMPWKFGEVLVVKDAGIQNGGLNNVLSAEPMPMHFDGMFKTAKVKDDDGNERLVPQPPQ